MLFASTLLEYVEASGDRQTAMDLYPIAAKQFTFFAANFTSDLQYKIPTRDMVDGGAGWHFVDCESVVAIVYTYSTHTVRSIGEPTLNKEAAEHSIMIYGLKAVQSLAHLLQLQEPTYSVGSTLRNEPVSTVITKLREANRAHYYDENQRVFVSGADKQISWASNAWAIIAGVIEEQDIGRQALTTAYTQEGSVPGMTPYLHHYVRLDERRLIRRRLKLTLGICLGC